MILYNTLTRKKEEFQPLRDKNVRLYSCGPTVYNFAHIGNLRTYIFVDILKRALLFDGYKVKHVMNITDVGHLTDDADAGEDKLEKGAAREKKTVWQVAEFYTAAFKNDIKQLNIKPPSVWSKATDHIKEQITLIKTLEKKGFTYETPRATYFDTAKVPDYGKLAKLKLEEQRAGAGERIGAAVQKDEDKKSPSDFVLWFKRVGKYKNHTMHWPSPWGDGFPGWHIECSAMSMKYLGETFDIHTGGVDHIAVHHTNEIAQSESATGKPFVRFWLHGEFLVIGGGEKMAKSGENFITLQTIVSRKINPLSFRYLVLSAHYHSQLTFTWASLEAAENGLHNLYEAIRHLRDSLEEGKSRTNSALQKPLVESYLADFSAALNDDLNTPQCIALIWKLVRDETVDSSHKELLLKKFDTVFALGLTTRKTPKLILPKEIKTMIEAREKMRAKKQFAEADQLRKKIEKAGYSLKDTVHGIQVEKREGRSKTI